MREYNPSQNTAVGRRAVVLVVLSIALVTPSQAFTFVAAPAQTQRCTSSSSLQLLPTQGSQLVAAFNAECCRREEEAERRREHPEVEASVAVTESQTTPHRSPARAFVSRLFSLPSRRHPKPYSPPSNNWIMDDLPKSSMEDPENDVVLFPIVGFRIASVDDEETGERKFRVLPTKSTASCQLPPAEPEEVVGWFSPCCRLNMFQEDPCRCPEETDNSI